MGRALKLTEVRRRLPRLVDEVAESHEPVIILRHGKAVARLGPCTAEDEAARAYALRGVPLEVSDDFDAELLDPWEALP